MWRRRIEVAAMEEAGIKVSRRRRRHGKALVEVLRGSAAEPILGLA